MKLLNLYLVLIFSLIFISGCYQTTDFGEVGSTILLINSSQNFTNTPFRIGNNINNSYFEKDGTLVFNGNATVWDDTQSNLGIARLPLSNPVVLKSWKGNLTSYAFEEKVSSSEENIEFSMQLSHSIKLGSNITCHLHYNVPTASIQNISFYLEYNCANVSSTYYSTNKKITKVFVLKNISYRNSIADFDKISCKGSISQIDKFYLKRLSSKDSYTNDVFIDYFDCHIEKDTLGSRTENIK